MERHRFIGNLDWDRLQELSVKPVARTLTVGLIWVSLEATVLVLAIIVPTPALRAWPDGVVKYLGLT